MRVRGGCGRLGSVGCWITVWLVRGPCCLVWRSDSEAELGPWLGFPSSEPRAGVIGTAQRSPPPLLRPGPQRGSATSASAPPSNRIHSPPPASCRFFPPRVAAAATRLRLFTVFRTPRQPVRPRERAYRRPRSGCPRGRLKPGPPLTGEARPTLFAQPARGWDRSKRAPLGAVLGCFCV